MIAKRNNSDHIGLCEITSMEYIVKQAIIYCLKCIRQMTNKKLSKLHRKNLLLLYQFKDFLVSSLKSNMTNVIKRKIIEKHMKNVETLIQVLNNIFSKFDRIIATDGGYF